MRIAHVRERHAPAGAPWRLAAALGPPARTAPLPGEWLDLEIARRRLVAEIPERAHNSVLFRAAHPDARRPPRGGAPDRRARRDRRRPTGRRGADDDALLARTTWSSGHRSCARRACATSTRSRDTSGRCGLVAVARSPRRGSGCRSSTSRTSPRSAGRTSRSGRRAAAPSSTSSSRSAPSSTRRPATSRRTARRRPSAATASSTTGRPATSSATRRPSGSGRPRARTSRRTIGPWIVTPDELADARAPGATGPALAMTAAVTDATGTRHADQPGHVGGCAVQLRRDARPCLGRRPRSGPATSSAAAPWARAACSR